MLLLGFFLVGGMPRLALAPSHAAGRIPARLDAALLDGLILPDNLLDRFLDALFLGLFLRLDLGFVQRAFDMKACGSSFGRRGHDGLGLDDRRRCFSLGLNFLAALLLFLGVLGLARGKFGLLLCLRLAQGNLLGI